MTKFKDLNIPNIEDHKGSSNSIISKQFDFRNKETEKSDMQSKYRKAIKEERQKIINKHLKKNEESKVMSSINDFDF